MGYFQIKLNFPQVHSNQICGTIILFCGNRFQMHFFSCNNSSLTRQFNFVFSERQNVETEPSIELAECRELQLNRYVQELIKLPQQVITDRT